MSPEAEEKARVMAETAAALYRFRSEVKDAAFYEEDMVKVIRGNSMLTSNVDPYTILMRAYRYVTSDTLDECE